MGSVIRSQPTGTLAVAAAAAGWGTWALWLRGSGLPPAWQSVLILGVISLLWAGPALWGHGRPHAGPRPARAWALLALVGLFDAGTYILYFGAVDRGPLAVAVVTHYLAPAIVAALSPLVLAEPIGRRTVFALAASLAGLTLLVGGGDTSGPVVTTALLGGGSAFFYAGATLLSKRLTPQFSSHELLAYHCALAALLLVPFAGPLPPLAAFSLRPVLGAALVGGGCGALYFAGLRLIPAQRAAVLTYLEPVVASFVGAFVLRERLAALSLLGAALVLAGGAAVALAADDRG